MVPSSTQEKWLCLPLQVLSYRRTDSADVSPCLPSLLRVCMYLSSQPLSTQLSGCFCFDIASCASLGHAKGDLHCCLGPTAA